MEMPFWPFPQNPLSDEDRKKIIGASDAPVIMRMCPWKTPYRLWREKMGLIHGSATNGAMMRGIAMEPIAREAFSNLMGKFFKPRLVRHPERNWMVASLDGISADGTEIVEIKCPGPKDHATAKEGFIPHKYVYQLYHQMAVTGLSYAWYYSWDGQEGVAIKFEEDQEKIDDMMKEELVFWECMCTRTVPVILERDKPT